MLTQYGRISLKNQEQVKTTKANKRFSYKPLSKTYLHKLNHKNDECKSMFTIPIYNLDIF